MEQTQRDFSHFFPGDIYQTQAGRKTSIWDKILLGSRWPMHSRVIRVILNSRKIALAGKYDRYNWVKTSHDVIECIELSGAKLLVEGLDQLRGPETAMVIVANHTSTLETFILPAMIASIRPVTFVVKKSLVEGSIFGPVIGNRDPIVVGRQSPREDLELVLKEGTKKLSEGTSVILFPESTRQNEFDPKKFNSLGVKLAKRAGVPIMPLALKTDFWGTGKLLRSFGPIHRHKTIHFKFAAPLKITGNGQEEHQQCLEYISAQLKLWQLERVI